MQFDVGRPLVSSHGVNAKQSLPEPDAGSKQRQDGDGDEGEGGGEGGGGGTSVQLAPLRAQPCSVRQVLLPAAAHIAGREGAEHLAYSQLVVVGCVVHKYGVGSGVDDR